MAIATAIAIYFLIWWIVLFAVLPWGVRAQGEESAPGTDPGAPRVPRLRAKLIWTTVVAGVVWGCLRVGLRQRLGHARRAAGAAWLSAAESLTPRQKNRAGTKPCSNLLKPDLSLDTRYTFEVSRADCAIWLFLPRRGP